MAQPQLRDRKLAVMGYRSVGKSSITIQFVENQFVDLYDPTIENTFTKELRIGNRAYRLLIIDTAGQDEYSLFPEAYTLDMHGYVLVYSVNSQKSFQVVKVIYQKLMDMVGNTRVPIILVANKKDLVADRVISTEEGMELARTWNDSMFMECSAKDNMEVQTIFKKIINETEKVDGNVTEEKSKCNVQ